MLENQPLHNLFNLVLFGFFQKNLLNSYKIDEGRGQMEVKEEWRGTVGERKRRDSPIFPNNSVFPYCALMEVYIFL